MVVLAEGEALAVELLGDETVAVQVVGDLKGKEGSYPHHPGSQDLVAEIAVIVGATAALLGQEAVVRVGGRILGRGRAEGGALFHALEDEVDAVLLPFLQTPQVRTKLILLPHSLFRRRWGC